VTVVAKIAVKMALEMPLTLLSKVRIRFTSTVRTRIRVIYFILNWVLGLG
jgi:hypothetical protein